MQEHVTGPLTADEIDTLQEIMNMAFGTAAAELAEVVDVFIRLTAPEVCVVPVDRLEEVLAASIPDFSRTNVVEQQFRGQGDGMALLLFPPGAEKLLISFFQPEDDAIVQPDLRLELEQEVLMEIGNVLIGATVGRLFELLHRRVGYLPPRATGGYAFSDLLRRGSFSGNDFAITLKAEFSFEDRHVHGQLYLINRADSLEELKRGLAEFWSSYQ